MNKKVKTEAKNFHINISSQLKKRLDQYCEDNHIQQTSAINMFVDEGLRKRNY